MYVVDTVEIVVVSPRRSLLILAKRVCMKGKYLGTTEAMYQDHVKSFSFAITKKE